jgi:hypothetical protein
MWEALVGELQSEAGNRQKLRLHLKNNYSKKKGWSVVQVVECLPSKYEVLSSNPSKCKKRKKGMMCGSVVSSIKPYIGRNLHPYPQTANIQSITFHVTFAPEYLSLY